MKADNPAILGAIAGEQPAQVEAEGEEYEFSDEQQDQIDNYVFNAIKLIHSEQSSDAIIKSLKSLSSPQAAVAKTANLVHDMLAGEAEKSEKVFNSIALMLGSAKMIEELIELGEAAKCFPPLSEEQRYAAHQLAMQHYFGRGIKEGWIDPVELQKSIEPLMPEELRQRGRAVWEEGNKPMGRTQQQEYLPKRAGNDAEGLLR